jgi:hypothetical protein
MVDIFGIRPVAAARFALKGFPLGVYDRPFENSITRLTPPEA